MPDASSTVAPAATSTGEADASGREMRLTPTPLPSLERVPVSELTPVTGEVPQDLLDAILQDAEARTGIAAGEMNLVRAEAVVWNDGSLGCPQPGVMYTHALVDGYWVILEYGDQTFDYRASDRGYFFVCEQSSLLKTLPPLGGASPTPQQ